MPIAIPFADDDGTSVLVPNFAPDGSALDEPAAIEQYKKSGKHFGKFDTEQNARAYAEQLSQQYAQPPVATPGPAPAPVPPAPAPPTAAPAAPAAAPAPLGPLRTRRGAPVITAPVTPGAPASPAPARGDFGPPMQSLEERLGAIPELNPGTGNPLTPDQRALAERYVTEDYHKEQQRTEEQRARLAKTLTDGAAMLADGKPFEYSEAEIRSLLPPEKADPHIQQLADAKTAGQFIGSVRISSPDELMAQRARLTAAMADPNATDYVRRQKLLGVFDAVVKNHQEELGKDPAGYIARYNQPVADAQAAIDARNPETFANYAATTLAEQARLGVAPEKRAVLPVGQAAAIAAQITAIDPTTQKPVDELRGLARAFGSGQGTNDYWPQVFGELVKQKLPGGYQVLANMDRPDQAAAADALSRAMGEVAKKGGMAVLKQNAGEEGKAIDKELASQLQQFRLSAGTQKGGQELYDNVLDSARALAMYYAFRGQDGTAAAKEAVDGIIGRKYDFVEFGDTTVRVPKGMDRTVSDAADRIKADFVRDPSQLPPIPGHPLLKPAERQAIWMDAIRNGGWANNNDESGIVLMGRFRDGTPVRIQRNDGSFVVLPFRDAAAYAEGPGPGDLPPRTAIPQAVEPNAPAGPRLPGGTRSPAPTGTVLPGLR